MHIKLAKDEIPVARVWRQGDDELFRKGNSDIKLPSKALEQKPSAKFL